MGRRRRKDPVEGIAGAVGALICAGIFFVPGFKVYLLFFVGLLVLGLAGFIIYRIRTRKNATLQKDHPSASEFTSHSLTKPTAPKEISLTEKLRKIDWFQFEKLVGAIYQSKGYTVQRIGGANPDGGVDLTIENVSEKFVIQCKQWKSWKVGVRQIREFLGTLTDSGVSKGIFITLQGYTGEAGELGAKHGITLLEERDVIGLLEEVNWKHNPVIISALDHAAKRCPKCESKMILKTATKGKNLGNQF